MRYVAALVLLYVVWMIRFTLKVRAFGLRGFLNPFYSPYFWLVALLLVSGAYCVSRLTTR